MNEPAADCPLTPWDGDTTVCRWCRGPLPKHARRWCQPDCERAFWEQHVWALVRPLVLRRDNRRCVACGQPGREVDHIEPRRGATRNASCWHHADNLRTLCTRCHAAVSGWQRRRRAAGLNDIIATDHILPLRHGSDPDRPQLQLTL